MHPAARAPVARLCIRFAIAMALALAAAAAAAPPGTPVASGPIRLHEVRAVAAGMDPVRLARVDSIIEAGIADGAAPGVALAVGRHGQLVRLRGYGRIDWMSDAAPVTDSTLYDLASLTKVLATTVAAMRHVDDGELSLDAPVWRYLPYWPRKGRAGRIRIRHLLTHTSGLPAGYDLWAIDGDRRDRLRRIARMGVRFEPGTRTLYSDLGMIVLGAVIERIRGERMDSYLQRRVWRPLGLRETAFNPLHPTNGSPFDLDRIAYTEVDHTVRHTHVHGVVHDLNAWAMDGVAGHAGLFSSARDLAVIAQDLLDGARGRESRIARPQTIRRFVEPRGNGRALGWDVPSGARSPAGRFLSADAFGHTGYTGTSIWIDPERDLFVVLLTNRVDPTAANERHKALRRDVHDAVALAIADETVVARRDARGEVGR